MGQVNLKVKQAVDSLLNSQLPLNQERAEKIIENVLEDKLIDRDEFNRLSSLMVHKGVDIVDQVEGSGFGKEILSGFFRHNLSFDFEMLNLDLEHWESRGNALGRFVDNIIRKVTFGNFGIYDPPPADYVKIEREPAAIKARTVKSAESKMTGSNAFKSVIHPYRSAYWIESFDDLPMSPSAMYTATGVEEKWEQIIQQPVSDDYDPRIEMKKYLEANYPND